MQSSKLDGLTATLGCIHRVMVNVQLETEPYSAGAQSVDCLLIPNLFSSVFSLLVQGESATHKNK